MPHKFKEKRSHYYRRCLMEVLLFTDVARGYWYNNQASRKTNKERPPEPATPLFVLQPRRERIPMCVWRVLAGGGLSRVGEGCPCMFQVPSYPWCCSTWLWATLGVLGRTWGPQGLLGQGSNRLLCWIHCMQAAYNTCPSCRHFGV